MIAGEAQRLISALTGTRVSFQFRDLSSTERGVCLLTLRNEEMQEGLHASRRLDQMPRVVSSRGVQFSVGVVHVVLGIALALFMNYFLSHLFSLGHQGEKWWDSYWLPFWAACLIYVVEAVWIRVPMAWFYGLLVTAPPYWWCAGSLAVVYLKNKTEVPVSVLLVSFLLGLSGAALNPIIASLVSHAGRDRNSR